jgi:hypothetical protein
MKHAARRLFAVLLALAGAAAQAQQTPQSPPPAENQERPEYRARALPNDTFKPSEQVQEDFPVPFPEDI